MNIDYIQREEVAVSDHLTTVIDRDQHTHIPRRSKIKRLWLAVIACLAVIALTVSATFAVHFYLGLQEQKRLSVGQTEQLNSLQQAISEQSEQISSLQAQLTEKDSTIASQQSTIDEQQSTIDEQQSTIDEQENTISSQKETIKKQQTSTTSKTTATSKSTTTKVNGVANYPEINTTQLKGKKLVALTFDDGPSQYTSKLLDALKKHDAKATFFVVGSRLGSSSSNALLKRMDDEGHVVGNHSQNHKNLRYLSANNVADEMFAAAKRIKDAIGHYPVVMRCPGGNYNSTVKSYAKSINVPIIQWDLDTVDWRDRNKTTVVNRVKKNVKDGSIVLMHDLYSTTVNAAIELIPYLQNQGYTLVTVPELLAAKYDTVEAGKVYFNG